MVNSKHFTRHIRRNHKEKKEVIEIMNVKDQKKKNQLVTLLRNAGNLEAKNLGIVVPKRRLKGDDEPTEETHLTCQHCHMNLMKTYAYRHRKRCFANPDAGSTDRSNVVMHSLIASICKQKYGKILENMYLKEEVLLHMRGDKVAEVVLNDILIVSWGDELLKTVPSNRSKYHISAKMRRCANFLIQMRLINPTKYSDFLSCLSPDAFDDGVEAIKRISKYDPQTRTFGAASTALQFGAYLQQIVDLTKRIILRKKNLHSE